MLRSRDDVPVMQRDRIDSARLVYFGCVDRAKVAPTVSAAVVGLRPPLAVSAALDAAISQDLAPDDTPDMIHCVRDLQKLSGI